MSSRHLYIIFQLIYKVNDPTSFYYPLSLCKPDGSSYDKKINNLCPLNKKHTPNSIEKEIFKGFWQAKNSS